MALLTLGLALSACSSNSSSSVKPPATSTTAPTPQTTSTSAPAPAGGEPTSGPGATKAIETNWEKFFNAKTPVSQRLALLENGSKFAPVIKAQAGSTLALAATAKVTHVTLTGTGQASVTYNILVGGNPALSGQSGVAVYQDGVWKVGDTSFCGLLQLENAGKSKGLPSACKG
ncbi:MAG TPA: hypothetical protein VFQ44_23735 [Streptosporangiaceae bacterium]|nr:hypothetical protein [Streptosporangiaceae bacterium]